MYAVAVIADILGLIPFVNIVTDILAAIILGIMADHEGINLYSIDRIGATLLTIGIEAIPGLSIVPAWTIRVYFAKQSKA